MRYSFDTSSFISPWNVDLPRYNYPNFWSQIENLITDGRIVATYMVYVELDRKDDELFQWAKNHFKMFIRVDYEQLRIVDEITKDYPGWVDPNSTQEMADPFVIALAKEKDLCVVTEERRNWRRGVDIPLVCGDLDVECMNIGEFIAKENIDP